MLSETDNSGIEYKSFTEESAHRGRVCNSVEVNGLNDETKAPFKSEIVLPRISSTESARGALNDANNVYSKLIQEVKRIESIERDQGLRRKRKKIVKLPKRRKGPGAGARVRIKLIRKERKERNEEEQEETKPVQVETNWC